MTLLTAQERTAIASDWAELFPTTGQIQRISATSDGMGGRARTWVTIYSGPLRITPARKDVPEAQDGGRLRDEMLYRIAFPAGTDVTFADRVVTAGETFAINTVREPGSLEMERVVFAERASK